MGQILTQKQTVYTVSSNLPCVIESDLGSGGQGEVYKATIEGRPIAVKWWWPNKANAIQRKALETLIKKAAPSPKFLWPIDLLSAPGVSGFGYLMALREPRYRSIPDWLSRRITPSFQALAISGFQLADSFIRLHALGLCYKDINYGNVFFDPTNGDIVICDNDNVTVDGERGGEEPGTPGFMAPEIVRGSALPSSRTDLYSLAVLLFLLFMLHHPLHGKREAEIKCLDDKAMGKLYGTEPVFIWHPTDMSNRPVRGYQDNAIVYWSIYPAFLRELFTKAFTGGLFNPDERIRESEWRQAMVTLRDSIFYCSCGKMNFYDGEELKRTGSVPGNCWACKKQLKLPPRIRIDKNLIMLNHDTQLFPHHIDRDKMWDFSRPVACITKHPSNPKIWGIKNLTNEKWVATLSDGTIKDVEPERSVSLQAGAKLNFGKSEGEIRV